MAKAKKLEALIRKLSKAIDQKHVVHFDYHSAKATAPEPRDVEPYLIVLERKSQRIKMVGWPLNQPANKKNDLRHYFLGKLNVRNVKVLHQTFDKIHVDDPGEVFNTPNVIVIHRVQFLDKNGKDIYARFTVDYDD